MKHFKVIVVAVVSAFVALAFATEKPEIVPSKTQPVQIAPMKINKETRVSITGIVREISDTTIVVERSVKDNMEAMEFTLEKPAEKIKVGDKVKISYIKKAGKNIARKVAPVVPKRISKKAAPASEVKSVPAEVTAPKK
jgi:hypothetical protein